MNATLAYMKCFFRDKDVASVTPTSRWCVKHVCRPIDFSRDITIVEYGAGAGVFASHILPLMTANSRFIMFETNDRLFRKLQKENDSRISCYNKSVEYVDQILPESMIGSVDYIISGIPFSFLDEARQTNILQKSKKILQPAGQFLAYQTSGHLKNPLKKAFGNVYTEWEWRNIPPMTVYRAEKV